MKCFTGLATGGKKLCSRRVTSCDPAEVGASARPTKAASANAMLLFTVASHAVLRLYRSDGDDCRNVGK